MSLLPIVGAAALLAALTGCSSHSDTAVTAGGPTASPTSEVTAVGTASAAPAVTVTPAEQPSSTPSPTSTVRPTAGVVTLTADDNGRTVHIAPGQMIAVRLAPNAGSYDPPVSDDEAVLKRTSSEGGYPEGGDAVARFSALSKGTAHITSQTDLSCMHTTPRCMIATRVFSVTVVVDPLVVDGGRPAR